MSDIAAREIVLPLSDATAAHGASRQVLGVEYFNRLVYQFLDVSPEDSEQIFQEGQFDRVFRREFVKAQRCELVDKLPPVYRG